MNDATYRLFEVSGLVVEVVLLPLLYAIAYYLRGIHGSIAEINHALASIRQWKEDHDQRDDERFEGVHARVERLEERVDSCQTILRIGAKHP